MKPEATHFRGILLLALLPCSAAWAQGRVAETVHNLSSSGPGGVRAASEEQICVFCHAPHKTSGVRPLWNRNLPAGNYQIYQSSTLDAKPNQPTGSSKLCLSCHDGTIALGSVLNRSDQIRIIGGEFMPAGLANLGTDLSDDHPVSFRYSSGLAASDRQLVSPSALPEEIKLDARSELQCTSCHDPHHNRNGKFLVRNNEFGALCTACHRMDGWSGCAHQTSSTTVAGAQGVNWPYGTVSANACRSCHRQHTAGGKERLMVFEEEEDNCLVCHDGQVARTNILAELNKLSGHDPRLYQDIHDPAEQGPGSQLHVECADCHNPHAVVGEPRRVPNATIGASMQKVPGITIGGANVAQVQHEYEVCFRCHVESSTRLGSRVPRDNEISNFVLKFQPSNASYHPVAFSSPSRDTISLVSGLAPGSIIRCTDCHNNNSGPAAGGSGPDGPHGSDYDFLLERNYTVQDETPESEFEYALCYKCHERSSILTNQSFPLHRLHIVDQSTPCSACHDPHGISRTQRTGSDQTHLMNFATRIVRPEATTGQLRFRDLGVYAGSCTLSCHGFEHLRREYGTSGMPGIPGP